MVIYGTIRGTTLRDHISSLGWISATLPHTVHLLSGSVTHVHSALIRSKHHGSIVRLCRRFPDLLGLPADLAVGGKRVACALRYARLMPHRPATGKRDSTHSRKTGYRKQKERNHGTSDDSRSNPKRA